MGEQIGSRGGVNVMDASEAVRKFDTNHDYVIDRHELSKLENWESIKAVLLVKSFMNFDVNGDGTVDEDEFAAVLQVIDDKFFTAGITGLLHDSADANADGIIHYVEFF